MQATENQPEVLQKQITLIHPAESCNGGDHFESILASQEIPVGPLPHGLEGRMRFLLDTNILIPLEDSKIVLAPALAAFVRFANEHGHVLVYHPASERDIARDSNILRRNQTLARLAQYVRLDQTAPCPWNAGSVSENDEVDNEILFALSQHAAHS